jgi:hypothetical protein
MRVSPLRGQHRQFFDLALDRRSADFGVSGHRGRNRARWEASQPPQVCCVPPYCDCRSLHARRALAIFFDVRLGIPKSVLLLLWIAITIWLYRLIVQRIRDAGHPKAISYLACISIANLALFLYLLFPGSKCEIPTIKGLE